MTGPYTLYIESKSEQMAGYACVSRENAEILLVPNPGAADSFDFDTANWFRAKFLEGVNKEETDWTCELELVGSL